MNNSVKKIITYKVSKDDVGIRLDQFLVKNIEDLSRTRLKNLILSNALFIGKNKKLVSIDNPAHKVKIGEAYYLHVPEAIDPKPLGQNIPLNIVHEDDDIIILNKPIGLVVHPAPGNYDRTLVNALISHCGDSLSGIGGEKRPGIVHRLDKNTSGLMVIAKNDKSHGSLSKQFASHGKDGKLQRAYKALVWGVPNNQLGKIKNFIGRSHINRKKMAVFLNKKPNNKKAITYWKKIKSNKELGFSLIECKLETGRTHQIRVHLNHINLPVIGDPLYGSGYKSKINKLNEDVQSHFKPLQNRQALHAYLLGFEHPRTGKILKYKEEPPYDMQNLIDLL